MTANTDTLKELADDVDRRAIPASPAVNWSKALRQAADTIEAQRKLLEQARNALAEELAAWDIDPPLAHVKDAHDAITEHLKAHP